MAFYYTEPFPHRIECYEQGGEQLSRGQIEQLRHHYSFAGAVGIQDALRWVLGLLESGDTAGIVKATRALEQMVARYDRVIPPPADTRPG